MGASSESEELYQQGRIYYNGNGVPKDRERAAALFRMAAERGHSGAEFALGKCLFDGNGTNKNVPEAIKWFWKAAEQGEDRALFALGTCYFEGTGLDQDQSKAIDLFMQAAEKGNVNAQFRLGRCYYFGEGVKQDNQQGVKWMRTAAENGDPAAQNVLGAIYEQGTDIPQDYEKAFMLYKKSAEAGYIPSLYTLGKCYEHGKGTDKNEKLAFEWYKKGAEKGFPPAQSNLAHCYFEGVGTDVNKSEAMKWFKLAAEQGEARAQFAYAIYLEIGDGVEKNLEEAAEWYKKAAAQGHPGAKEQLEELEAELTKSSRYNNPQAGTYKYSSHKPAIIAVIIIAILVLITAVYFIVIRRGTGTKSTLGKNLMSSVNEDTGYKDSQLAKLEPNDDVGSAANSVDIAVRGTGTDVQDSTDLNGALEIVDESLFVSPFDQRYWVIFTEGYRNNRLEASTVDSTILADDLNIVWNTSLILNDTSGSDGCNQYYLDEDNNWVQIGTYHRLTDKATSVIASNLDVVDRNGNILIDKCSYDAIDWTYLNTFR